MEARLRKRSGKKVTKPEIRRGKGELSQKGSGKNAKRSGKSSGKRSKSKSKSKRTDSWGCGCGMKHTKAWQTATKADGKSPGRWVATPDPESNQDYYWHTVTMERHWALPPGVPVPLPNPKSRRKAKVLVTAKKVARRRSSRKDGMFSSDEDEGGLSVKAAEAAERGSTDGMREGGEVGPAAGGKSNWPNIAIIFFVATAFWSLHTATSLKVPSE